MSHGGGGGGRSDLGKRGGTQVLKLYRLVRWDIEHGFRGAQPTLKGILFGTVII